ncbi:MAG: hypothetical protein NC924_01410 [Candidatus Omnitrophica bacterium]|nr:hypothetical protein [Candidatus Omnitrophota bacterium]
MKGYIYKKNSTRGISLIEILFSALLASVLAATLYGAFVVAADAKALAHHRLIAIYWTVAAIEWEKSALRPGMPVPNDFQTDQWGVPIRNELQQYKAAGLIVPTPANDWAAAKVDEPAALRRRRVRYTQWTE